MPDHAAEDAACDQKIIGNRAVFDGHVLLVVVIQRFRRTADTPEQKSRFLAVTGTDNFAVDDIYVIKHGFLRVFKILIMVVVDRISEYDRQILAACIHSLHFRNGGIEGDIFKRYIRTRHVPVKTAGFHGNIHEFAAVVSGSIQIFDDVVIAVERKLMLRITEIKDRRPFKSCQIDIAIE